jgi:Flp pilus assembly secretin CpaC
MLLFRLAQRSVRMALAQVEDVGDRRKGAQMTLMSIAQPAAAGAIAIAAVSVVAFPEAWAQEPNSVQSGPVQAVTGSVQQITLTMGKGGLFQTAASYAKISVTDEKIVEVTPQSDREFVFNPKGIGSTNVFVFDEKNRLIARLDINVVGKIAKVQEVREETYEEAPERVTVYSRIYDAQGSPAKPALYRCNHTNCEIVSEAPDGGPGRTGTTTTSPKGAQSTDNENPQ